MRLRVLACALAMLWGSGVADARNCPEGAFENFPPDEATAAGFDPAVLAEAIQDLRRSDRDIRSLLVLKDCKLVVELYKAGLGRDFTHSMYSVAKSFVVTLAGILVNEGKLSLDAPLTTALDRPRGIADATWARAGKVRVRHVFGMLSGYEYIHTPTYHPLYTAMDRRVIALLPGTEATPGTRFNYSDADAVLAAATVARASGRDLLAFARDALSSRWGSVKSSGGTGTTPVCITLAVGSAFALWTRRNSGNCTSSAASGMVTKLLRRVLSRRFGGQVRTRITAYFGGAPHPTTDFSRGVGKARECSFFLSWNW
jgi:CubicO group peptidase (beta-lactamase class C family)